MKYINKNYIKVVTLISSMIMLLVISGCTGVSTTAAVSSPIELNLCAGVGLTDALTEINKLYEQKNNNMKIVTNFAASGTLQKQIEQGAPADVFFTPGGKQIQALQEGGFLLDDTWQNLLNNKIVLIVPGSSTLTITDFKSLLNEDVKRIAVGDPAFVPAGTYAIQALDMFKITDQLNPKLLLCSDVRQVLNYVESGNVEAGIVFATDAAISDKVRVVVDAPAEINNTIVFSCAIIKTSNNVEAAKAYVAFLTTPEAKAIFEKYGFVVVKK